MQELFSFFFFFSRLHKYFHFFLIKHSAIDTTVRYDYSLSTISETCTNKGTTERKETERKKKTTTIRCLNTDYLYITSFKVPMTTSKNTLPMDY